jgi:hypothetical protein
MVSRMKLLELDPLAETFAFKGVKWLFIISIAAGETLSVLLSQRTN